MKAAAFEYHRPACAEEAAGLLDLRRRYVVSEDCGNPLPTTFLDYLLPDLAASRAWARAAPSRAAALIDRATEQVSSGASFIPHSRRNYLSQGIRHRGKG